MPISFHTPTVPANIAVPTRQPSADTTPRTLPTHTDEFIPAPTPGSTGATTRFVPEDDGLPGPGPSGGTTSSKKKKRKRGFFARIGDAIRSATSGHNNGFRGIWKNIHENSKRAFGGIGKIFRGDWKGGFGDLGRAYIDGHFGTGYDHFLLNGGKGVSAIQTLLGLEPVGRKLTDSEKEAMREIFGDSVDLSKVRIKHGKAGVFGNSGAFVHGNTMYFGENTEITTDLLAHEMVHVWQHQNGGTDYMREALESQELGDAYDFEEDVINGVPWEDLEPEQQAELVQVAVQRGYFDPDSANFGTLSVNGVDVSDYMASAVEQLRSGTGAP